MMVDHCTEHEQNPLIHLRYTGFPQNKKLADSWTHLLTSSSILPTEFVTKYISLQTYKSYDKMDINATFWHKAKVYFTFIKSLSWLITVPNTCMNKINQFFSEISQQT